MKFIENIKQRYKAVRILSLIADNARKLYEFRSYCGSSAPLVEPTGDQNITIEFDLDKNLHTVMHVDLCPSTISSLFGFDIIFTTGNNPPYCYPSLNSIMLASGCNYKLSIHVNILKLSVISITDTLEAREFYNSNFSNIISRTSKYLSESLAEIRKAKIEEQRKVIPNLDSTIINALNNIKENQMMNELEK